MATALITYSTHFCVQTHKYREGLNFLNKVQKMEDVQTRNSSNCESPISKREHSSAAGAIDRVLNSEHQVYVYNQHSIDPELQAAPFRLEIENTT